jgi:hypothetical protein
VSNTRLPNLDPPGRSPQGEHGIRAFITRADPRRSASNDNAAPLLRRVQRGLFAVSAALAVAWLFWVGFLR